jgi:predicted metal-binding membrane protein
VTATLPSGPPAPTHAHEAEHASPWRQVTATPMSRARAGILVGLLVLTVASWAFVLGLGSHGEHGNSPTMGLNAGLFLAVWIAMMIATMFPATAPMILMVARISANKRQAGHAVSPLKYFLAGYLLLWTALGVPTYFLAVGAESLAGNVDVVADNAARIGGALIVAGGLYQFSKLKDRCLTACRSPLHFVMAHWRDGRLGALKMGLHHGWHCAGCCWALMLVMFPLGMMNVAALATVTALIYAEKVLPTGNRIRYAAGFALVAFGIAVMLAPDLLPGSLAHYGHHGMQ